MVVEIEPGELCRDRAEIEEAQLVHGNQRACVDVAGGPAAARRFLRHWGRVRRRQAQRDAAVRGYLVIGGEG